MNITITPSGLDNGDVVITASDRGTESSASAGHAAALAMAAAILKATGVASATFDNGRIYVRAHQ